MRSVGRSDTGPERAVRSILHRAGYRFRKNVKTLPGTPDIVLPKYRTAIFVHGCFWHQHSGCKRATKPASRREYWDVKLAGNIERDRLKADTLRGLGWNVVTVWECEIAQADALIERLRMVLASHLGLHR